MSTVNVEGFNTTYQEVVNQIDQNDDYIKTGSNTGTGSEVFKQKSAQDLQFRKLKSTTLTITQNADDISIEENGTQQLDDGDQKSPSLFFTNATGSGLFRTGTQGVGITTNQVERIHFHPNYIEPFSQYRNIDGAIGTLAYTFKNDLDTGIFRPSSNTMNFVAGGNNAMIITDGSSIITNWQLQATATGIGYAFFGDDDTGLKWSSLNAFKMLAGNGDVAECNVNNFVLHKPMISSVQSYKFYRASASQTLTINNTICLDYATMEVEQNASDISRSVVSSKARYIVSTTGIYLIVYDFNCGIGANFIYSWITKNDPTGNANPRYGFNFHYSLNDYHLYQGSTILKLNASDYINLFSFNGLGSPTFPIDTSKNTYLQIYRLC